MDTEADRTDGRRFHLIARIGAGAFGEVYLAEQDSGAGFRRKVAIKLLNEEVQRFAEAGRRMRDEARILGRLSHRHIVTVLDLLKLGDRWAIIMDFVPGADLEQVILALEEEDAWFPAAAALEAGAAVLDALDAAFVAEDGSGGQLGVIHRDIKPSNVRLTGDGEVKVLDFGVARVNLDTREAQTRATGWIGTERYMSPERILCEGDSAAGDVYAAAASVVELINRRPLGRTPVLEERHAPFVDEALVEARARIEGPDETVDEIVDWLRRALATLPEDRPTARELSDALQRLARRLPSEPLQPFARRFVPRVEALLGREPEPIDGVLSERSSSSAVLGGRSSGLVPNPTLEPGSAAGGETFDASLLPDEEPAAAPVPPTVPPASGPATRRPLVLGAVAVVVVLVLLGVTGAGATVMAIGAFGTGAGESAEPTTVTNTVGDGSEGEAGDEAAAGHDAAGTGDAVEQAGDGSEGGAGDEGADEAGADEAGNGEATEEAGIDASEGAGSEGAAAVTAPEPAAPRPAPAPKADAGSATATTERVRRALVVLQDASSLEVTCGGVTANGTVSASIRDFPAGPCTVRASHLGRSYTAEVVIDRPKEVRCTLMDGALSCS